MTSEGGSAQAVAAATADPNLLEYRAEGSQGHTYQYYPSAAAPTPIAWPVHGGDHSNLGNRTVQNVSYQYNQQQPTTVQDATNMPSIASTSTASGTDNASHMYPSYATYPTSSNPYGYPSSEYTNYYSGYQQQPTQPYTQATGTYQNSGSYQPISSFQNTGSYAGSTSYPSTYYNPGDYQTTGAYNGSSYSSQTNLWSQGNYTNYPQQYGNYSHDTSNAYSSSSAAATTNYQQHYQQWADYYSSHTEVTCAPGTENTTVATTAVLSCPVPGVSSGYAAPVNQPQAAYAPAWKPEIAPSALPSHQTSSPVGAYNEYWKHATQAYQNQSASSSQSNFQKPLDVNSSHPSAQDQRHTLAPQPQLPNSLYTEVQQTHPQPLQPLTPADTLRVSNLQIPSNPRIASNLALSMPKTFKDTATSSVTAKPAYVSVSLPKPANKALSGSASDSNLKPGMFPASLRGYVERALARCKDEKQRAACQEAMKEIITKATADGTLYSRDWDIEPLFPLPDTSTVNNEQSAAPAVSLSIFKRSPSRRTKSRWEPLPEDKPIEKPASTHQDSARQGVWAHFNGRDHKLSLQSVAGKSERKDATFSRFSTVEQTTARSAHRPSKRQHFVNDSSATENGDASSDSDKEQSLTAYYSGAITLANSPEERKRRENRSKRFEKGNGQRSENRFRPKKASVGNLYARRASALVLSKTLEDGVSRAVEDIDWDALTVKGTCQEIEKRYLRLTSAPDPSTVRPEEVLEKALHMVQNSQKNYLYKCDQLKSIRQDLTVQRIRNELTVKVYETHARLALEFGDLPEFNQSQSQLKSLYTEGIAGCHMEFSAYNLLSISLLSNNRRDLLSLMSRLSDETKRHEAVKHALSVRSAVTSGNYVLFFRLYKSAPNLNTCLMDLCVEKMRFEAVKCMSRTYRPTIPVSYVAQVLGFSSVSEGEGADEGDVDGLEECMEWLKAHGACLIADNNGEMMIDAKVSSSSLCMPEPDDAVAHGDANLAVNDFFTRAST
ncbi:SAC3 family protein A-like isoform X1 [Chenopodium quinoa]|uniref:SAC3 family protein A-like isoform X1 n=1 Tax=Chenopodium quinoa TaxID=63459 RepID=UPI000B7972AB|nr:SAC3 family protein A-like isoform X1 [Chenopodium quinoa]